MLQKKKRGKKRRLDNAVAGTSKIQSFFVTTTACEDETSEGNPGNRNDDAVDVVPPLPAPENESAAETTGPVDQEFYLTLDNLTDCALFQIAALSSGWAHGHANWYRQFFITFHAAQNYRLLSAARMATGAFSRKNTTMRIINITYKEKQI